MSDRAQPGAEGSHLYNVEMGEVFGEIGFNKVVQAGDPSRSAQYADSIDETVLNAFDATHSGTSLTVTIDPGEAFVDGWVARDTSTDVDLAASTTGQSVYVGWDTSAFFDSDVHETRDEADAVIVGLESAFESLDPKLELWTFDTDADGVTAATDQRRYSEPAGPPVGVITMWSGEISDIPAGWVLCDGNNGTPNLQDRFVVGSGNNYAVGDSGGSTEHNHDVTGAGAGDFASGDDSLLAANHLPPYYSLAYIQKL